jgi:RNA polymerase sigma-70 factor, ECF subfamily
MKWRNQHYRAITRLRNHLSARLADSFAPGVTETAPRSRLTPIVCDELHRLARHYIRGERPGPIHQTSAFAVSALLMRRILVEHARRHNLKRGGGVPHVSLEETAIVGGDRAADLIALDDVMVELARLDPRKVQVVEVEETAEVLQVSPVTVTRDWSTAKAWLYRELTSEATDGS